MPIKFKREFFVSGNWQYRARVNNLPVRARREGKLWVATIPDYEGGFDAVCIGDGRTREDAIAGAFERLSERKNARKAQPSAQPDDAPSAQPDDAQDWLYEEFVDIVKDMKKAELVHLMYIIKRNMDNEN